jgi:hypothetical protein
MFARNSKWSSPVAVVDPFCGTGTVGLAARTLGCPFYAIDKDIKVGVGVSALMTDAVLLKRFAVDGFLFDDKQKKKTGAAADEEADVEEDPDYEDNKSLKQQAGKKSKKAKEVTEYFFGLRNTEFDSDGFEQLTRSEEEKEEEDLNNTFG